MAPWLPGKTFVVVPAAELPAPCRVLGIWFSKVAAPKTANRFILTIASAEFVGFTMTKLEPATPRVEGSKQVDFCACAEAEVWR